MRQVSPYLQVPASLSSANGREEVLVSALEAGQKLHVLRLDAATAISRALGAGRIVLTNGLARDLDVGVGVGVGDTVTLLSPAGERRLQVGHGGLFVALRRVRQRRNRTVISPSGLA